MGIAEEVTAGLAEFASAARRVRATLEACQGGIRGSVTEFRCRIGHCGNDRFQRALHSAERAARDVAEAERALAAAVTAAGELAAALGMTTAQASAGEAASTAGGRGAASSRPVSPTSSPPPPEVVEAAGNLPVRPEGRGPTHGRLLDHDHQPIGATPIRSHQDRSLMADLDLDDTQRRSASLQSHVEAHVAAAMRRRDVPHDLTLVINNQVCRGPLSCHSFLESILPSASRLTIYTTDEHGTRFWKTYHGTGERIRR
ncbi:MAG: hypothetical protein KJO75_08440 [Dactylosporangium sp.]|nr:hypothetical protein [Dactylosporangium sp.]